MKRLVRQNFMRRRLTRNPRKSRSSRKSSFATDTNDEMIKNKLKDSRIATIKNKLRDSRTAKIKNESKDAKLRCMHTVD